MTPKDPKKTPSPGEPAQPTGRFTEKLARLDESVEQSRRAREAAEEALQAAVAWRSSSYRDSVAEDDEDFVMSDGDHDEDLDIPTVVIGPDGGKIKLREAGLTATVPRRSLDREVSITVTAAAGKLMGYEFHPHGLQFQRPVKVEQDAKKLATPKGKGKKKPKLFVAYYNGLLNPQVEALEVLPLIYELVLKGRKWSFFISHFSGYVVATD